MQVCGARMDLLTAAYCVQCGLPRLQSTEKNDRCRSTASTTRFFRGMSPGYGRNVAIEVKGPLATSGRVNVAHGRAEEAGAVTPTILHSSKRMR